MLKQKGIEFLNTGIFPATVCLIYGMKYDECIEEINKMGAFGWAGAIKEDKSLFDRAKWLTMGRDHEERKYYYISMQEFDFSDFDMCKIAHEVLHVCQFFLPDVLERNVEIEAECYLHTHLMDQCLKVLRSAEDTTKMPTATGNGLVLCKKEEPNPFGKASPIDAKKYFDDLRDIANRPLSETAVQSVKESSGYESIVLVTSTCLNSSWTAYGLHEKGKEHCECGYECKVNVMIGRNGHPPRKYALTVNEYIDILLNTPCHPKESQERQ